jgi:hypothetical protein
MVLARMVLATVVVTLAACGTKTSTPTVAPTPAGSPTPARGTTDIVHSMAFVAAYERIWAALPRAYAAVGLTVNAVDTVTRSVGFAGTIRTKIGDTPMSKFFNCGNQMGENADRYDIHLFVASQAGHDPKTGRVVVTTGLRVSARSPAFASTTTFCTSSGELERRIWAALSAELR